MASVRIKQNFENAKYKMIETNHQKLFVIGVLWLVPDLFSKIIKGDWDQKSFRTIKILKQLSTEFHSIFVCKVSIGSDW